MQNYKHSVTIPYEYNAPCFDRLALNIVNSTSQETCRDGW